MRDFEKVADLATATGFSPLVDLLDASDAERDHLHQLLLTQMGTGARASMKILGATAGAEIQPKRPRGFQEVGIFAKLNSRGI